MVRIATTLALFAGLSGAVPATAPGSIVSAPVADAQRLSAGGSDWSPERMRAARPLDLAPTPARSNGSAEPAPGRAMAESFIAPDPAGSREDYRLHSGAPDPAAETYAGEFESGELADPTAPGNRAHGRIFFRIPDGGDAACSGTVINSNRRSVVLTAGHCVHEGGNRGDWFEDWVFVPAYEEGRAPFGIWRAKRLYATGPWVEFSDQASDMAVAVVRRNDERETVQDVVGARGIKFGGKRRQQYMAYGYPADGDFDGETPRFCRSGFMGTDENSKFFIGPRTISIGCDMTFGSSGGAWITDGRFASSLISYGYDALPDIIYGPYFDSLAKQLFEAPLVKCGNRPATILGGPGDERIKGTHKRDVIVGRGGDDVIRGRGGNDVLCGNTGDDRISGEAGRDRLLGNAGRDRLSGGTGRDVCNGGGGKDPRTTGCQR